MGRQGGQPGVASKALVNLSAPLAISAALLRVGAELTSTLAVAEHSPGRHTQRICSNELVYK